MKATGPGQVHTYRQPGNYTVSLTVMKNDPANGTMVSNVSVRKNFIIVQQAK
jgi:PKD repeat protein